MTDPTPPPDPTPDPDFLNTNYNSPTFTRIQEAVRAAIAQAVSQLATLDELQGLAGQYESALADSESDRLALHATSDAQAAQIADLTARVAALEAPPTPTPAPTGGTA